MTRVTADFAISLDGCIAGPNVSADNPGGDGAWPLHEWFASLASWRERQGLAGGTHNRDSEIVGEWFDATGAVIMGRRMFDYGESAWGDNPPFRAPVFVVTHRPRATEVKDGGTSYTFVTDGIHSAFEQARAAAGRKNVDVAGGAETVQQFIEAGLVDELQVHVVPILLGDGIRLFDRIDPARVNLDIARVVESPNVTHLQYRVTTNGGERTPPRFRV